MFLAGCNSVGRAALRTLAGEGTTYPSLKTTFGGIDFESPLGIAPGWDKTSKSILAWQALGARHHTVGGVTLYPQDGNPMPRLRTFDQKLGDRGKSKSLNAYGFYNPGADVLRRNIAAQRDKGSVEIPIFVQVTANKEFYQPSQRAEIPGVIAKTVHKIIEVADGINFGLSSPNTLGMRDAQS